MKQLISPSLKMHEYSVKMSCYPFIITQKAKFHFMMNCFHFIECLKGLSFAYKNILRKCGEIKLIAFFPFILIKILTCVNRPLNIFLNLVRVQSLQSNLAS